MKEKIRVFIIDDLPFISKELKKSLSTKKDINVVGTALNPVEGLQYLKEQIIDVLIMDIGMPDMNGFEGADMMEKEMGRERMPNIIFYTVLNTPKNTELAKQRGYSLVGKNISSENFYKVIKNVISGKQVLMIGNEEASIDILQNLNQREKDISTLLCKELALIDIAEILSINQDLVNRYIENIKIKTKLPLDEFIQKYKQMMPAEYCQLNCKLNPLCQLRKNGTPNCSI